MSDEQRKDEEPEVEAHANKPSAKPSARAFATEPGDEVESDDVEAHSFKPGVKPTVHP
jgi:hypothetical protein